MLVFGRRDRTSSDGCPANTFQKVIGWGGMPSGSDRRQTNMSIRSLRLRPSLAVFPSTAQCARRLQYRKYGAQSTAPEQDLAAQAELAAKAKVLSPYHKVSFDERKVRIPWQDGKTSSLYVPKAVFHQTQLKINCSSCSHHIYLRDHCRCSECFHPVTKQRLLNTFEVRVMDFCI